MKTQFDYEGRKIRGYAIISKGDNIEKLGRGVFCVPSQSIQGKNYIVFSHGVDNWECECPDWQSNEKDCKHIHAIKFWLSLKKKIEEKTTETQEPIQENKCVFCASESIVKFGRIEGTDKQRFRCKNCKKTFVADKDFKKFKGSPKVITAVIDLYFKGVSLRKIQDHIKQFYDLQITHVTIYHWIKRFTKLMNEYVSHLNPKVSGMWHTDEQMIKMKEKDKWAYCWNVIDAETRFLIANNVTEGRDIDDARAVFKKTKQITENPDVVVTDGLFSYRKAIRREFKKAQHIGKAGLMKKENNNKVERFHNTFRERDKVIRGFQNPKTAQEWTDAFRLYYNFIRPHSKFNGLTPSQVAGIKLNLPNNRWEGLLRKSLETKH